jgi:hypothetical protein
MCSNVIASRLSSLIIVTEIGISALKDQLIHAQRTEIDLLRSQRDNPSDVIHPNHDSIFGESSIGRDQTMTILSEQYQRLSQAQPIQQMPLLVSSSPSFLSQDQAAVSRAHNSGAIVLSNAGVSGDSPLLMDRKRLQVDAYGIADFQSCTSTGRPCQPGRYKILCNFEMTEVHVRGIFMNGSVTGATFNGVMYAVALFLLLLLRYWWLLANTYFFLLCSIGRTRSVGYFHISLVLQIHLYSRDSKVVLLYIQRQITLSRLSCGGWEDDACCFLMRSVSVSQVMNLLA